LHSGAVSLCSIRTEGGKITSSIRSILYPSTPNIQACSFHSRLSRLQPGELRNEGRNHASLVSQAFATCRLPGRPIRVVPEGSASESTADSDSRSRREPVARYKAVPSSQIQPLFSPLLAPPPRLTEDSERGNGGAELGF